jgi:hypothetical protein
VLVRPAEDRDGVAEAPALGDERVGYAIVVGRRERALVDESRRGQAHGGGPCGDRSRPGQRGERRRDRHAREGRGAEYVPGREDVRAREPENRCERHREDGEGGGEPPGLRAREHPAPGEHRHEDGDPGDSLGRAQADVGGRDVERPRVPEERRVDGEGFQEVEPFDPGEAVVLVLVEEPGEPEEEGGEAGHAGGRQAEASRPQEAGDHEEGEEVVR